MVDDDPRIVDELVVLIAALSDAERRELRRVLSGWLDDDPDAGVREPRRPIRPRHGGEAVAEQ